MTKCTKDLVNVWRKEFRQQRTKDNLDFSNVSSKFQDSLAGHIICPWRPYSCEVKGKKSQFEKLVVNVVKA